MESTGALLDLPNPTDMVTPAHGKMEHQPVRPRSDGSDDFVLPVATIRPENSRDKIPSDSAAEQPLQFGTEKLCGWLTRHKKTAFGALKTTDKKWYEYVDDRGKLFVFQSPDDTVPQESIDISRSAIVVDPEFSEKPGVFALRFVLFLSIDHSID